MSKIMSKVLYSKSKMSIKSKRGVNQICDLSPQNGTEEINSETQTCRLSCKNPAIKR
jgi:hypothetical protein